jgi:hypothetical protein
MVRTVTRFIALWLKYRRLQWQHARALAENKRLKQHNKKGNHDS